MGFCSKLVQKLSKSKSFLKEFSKIFYSPRVAQKVKNSMTFFWGHFWKMFKNTKKQDLDLRKHRLSKKILKIFLLPPAGPKSQK